MILVICDFYRNCQRCWGGGAECPEKTHVPKRATILPFTYHNIYQSILPVNAPNVKKKNDVSIIHNLRTYLFIIVNEIVFLEKISD